MRRLQPRLKSQIKKYQYHLKPKGGASSDPITHVAYFTSREAFEAMLKKWSVRGWNYFETDEDRKINDVSKNIKSFKYGSSLDTILNCDNPNKSYPCYDDRKQVEYIKPTE